MVGLNEKAKEVVSKSNEELERSRHEKEQRRYQVTEECSNGPKARYKSTNDPERFVKYLRSRIDKWEDLTQKKGNGRTHAVRMLAKTNEIIESLSA